MPAIPEEIIVRSIQKTASDEDMKILNKWLIEDKKNVEYYFQLEEIWHLKKLLTKESLLEGWQRLSKEVENPLQQKPISAQSQKNGIFVGIRYAAAVIIGILIASAIWMNLPVRQSTGEPEMLVQNVVYNQTGVQVVLLPDSSKVWVNENTRIIYPEKFAENRREISLEGNAYFDVQKKPETPFIVHIGNVNVEVVGTEFFVEAAREEEAYVTLILGGVNIIYKDSAEEEKSSSLIPGQQVAINRSNGEMRIADVDTDYYIAWKDGTYHFNDRPLEEIINFLSKRLNWDIQLDSQLKNKRFTGRIASEDNIHDILTNINKSYPIEYKITGKTIKISRP